MFTYSQEEFDILPDYIFTELAKNMGIKKTDVEDIIDELKFKSNDDGSETINIKTPYILVGTADGLSRSIDDYPLDQADDILEEHKIDSRKLDDFSLLVKASKLHDGHIWLSDADDDVITLMKTSDFDPSIMHNLLALPVRVSKPRGKKKKKTLSKAEIRALSNIVDPPPNLVSGSVKTRALKAKEVDSVTIPVETTTITKVTKSTKKARAKKMKPKELSKLSKSALIDLLMK
jgi:hypothetical protein